MSLTITRVIISFFLVYVFFSGVLFFYNSSLNDMPTIMNYVTSNKSVPMDFRTTRTTPPKPIKPPLKYILFWTYKFSSKTFYFGYGNKPFKQCRVKNCFTTSDKKLKSVEEFDAILFHGPENKKFNKEPEKRSAKQMYVFVSKETPEFFSRAHYNATYWYQSTRMRNFYNWTMTYRSDSDIVDKYGYVVRSKTNYKLPTVEAIRRRPKKVAWLVSHCPTASKREDLYDQLSQYIQSDKYGKCGNLTCAGRMSNQCYNYLEKNYYFYLSFENAICKEYVTEKLYYILRKNLVPVVYGGADYTVLAPPNSFINVFDFPTVEHLANYLNYLIENPEKYLEYFKWKRDYKIDTSPAHPFCVLCAKLNAPREEKMYPDIKQWFSPGQCEEKLPAIFGT